MALNLLNISIMGISHTAERTQSIHSSANTEDRQSKALKFLLSLSSGYIQTLTVIIIIF